MDPSPQNVRLALLGLGAAARDIHWPACKQLAGVEVVAGADPDPAARDRFAQLAPQATLHADAAALLAAERPDWVSVLAPPRAHRELCLLALAHGANVFCEKPFAPSLEDARAIALAASHAGCEVAVNHQFSRMPIFEAARRAIGGPELGELVFLQLWQHLREEATERGGWRAGGETMREFGTHVVDLAVALVGALPVRVTAHMPRFQELPGADLIDVVALEFADGRVASIVLDRVCRGAHRYLELRLDGELASLRASIGGRARFSLFATGRSRRPGARLELAAGGQAWLECGERRRVLARNPRNAFADATALHLRSVLDATARGVEPPASARAACQIVEVVEAAYASARSGASVPIGGSAGQA